MTIKIRISPTIDNEYLTRAVYDFIPGPGVHAITEEQARELLEDAKHQVFDTDMTPAGITRAYAALASNLMAALDRAA